MSIALFLISCVLVFLVFFMIYTWTRFADQSHQVQVHLKKENTLRRIQKEVGVNIMVVAWQQALKELAAPNMEINHYA